MNQEYFTVALSSEINLGLSLVDMATVAQFEAKNICLVPGVANFWYGVVNFKGSLLWVLDSDRFFNLNLNVPRNRQTQKLTTVILKNQQSVNQKRVAIVTQKLQGILSVEPSSLKPLTDDVCPALRECCSAIAQTELQTAYILDSAALLNRLHQQSILVSA